MGHSRGTILTAPPGQGGAAAPPEFVNSTQIIDLDRRVKQAFLCGQLEHGSAHSTV